MVFRETYRVVIAIFPWPVIYIYHLTTILIQNIKPYPTFAAECSWPLFVLKRYDYIILLGFTYITGQTKQE